MRVINYLQQPREVHPSKVMTVRSLFTFLTLLLWVRGSDKRPSHRENIDVARRIFALFPVNESSKQLGSLNNSMVDIVDRQMVTTAV